MIRPGITSIRLPVLQTRTLIIERLLIELTPLIRRHLHGNAVSRLREIFHFQSIPFSSPLSFSREHNPTCQHCIILLRKLIHDRKVFLIQPHLRPRALEPSRTLLHRFAGPWRGGEIVCWDGRLAPLRKFVIGFMFLRRSGPIFRDGDPEIPARLVVAFPGAR